MQPGVPFRGHLGPFGLASIHDPALFAAGAPAAAPQRLRPLLAIITVAETVGADQLAAEPGQQARADRHWSIRASCRSPKRGVYGIAGARWKRGCVLPRRLAAHSPSISSGR